MDPAPASPAAADGHAGGNGEAAPGPSGGPDPGRGLTHSLAHLEAVPGLAVAQPVTPSESLLLGRAHAGPGGPARGRPPISRARAGKPELIKLPLIPLS